MRNPLSFSDLPPQKPQISPKIRRSSTQKFSPKNWSKNRSSIESLVSPFLRLKELFFDSKFSAHIFTRHLVFYILII